MRAPLETAICLAPVLVAVAVGSVAAENITVTLTDFETPAEIAKWTTSAPAVKISWSDEHATGGRGCVLFQVDAHVEGASRWPSMRALATSGAYPVTDWSDYAAVAVDVWNPQPYAEDIALEFRDDAGRNGWSMHFGVPPRQRHTIRVETASVAGKIRIDGIQAIIFYCTQPAEPQLFFLDSLRLIRAEGSKLDAVIEQLRLQLPEEIDASALGLAEARRRLAEFERQARAQDLTRSGALALTEKVTALADGLEELLYKAPYAFDFGTEDSPIRPYFRRVTASTVYTPERGFGWRSADGLRHFATEAVREWTWSDYRQTKVPPDVYYSDLTQDCVAAEETAEFLVDLPPGSYCVYLLAGLAKDVRPVVANFRVETGAGLVEEIRVPRPLVWTTRELTVELGGGPLVLRLVPETGWALNAMLIYPHADARRARAEQIRPLEDEVFALPPDLKAAWARIPNPPPNPAPETSDADRERGYILFSRGHTRNVYPDSAPAPAEITTALTGFATPGEYEPITFAVYALRPLEQVRVSLPRLVADGGAAIPPENIDVRTVHSWDVRMHYGSRNQFRQVPEMLLRSARVDLDAAESRRFWLTVKIPDDARAGVYRGTVAVTAGNAPGAELDVSLEVLPFRLLRDPDKTFGMYYYDPRARISADQSESVRNAIEAQARAECIDMREHGMNTLQLRSPQLVTLKEKEKYRIDASAFAADIEFYRSTGLVTDRPSMLFFGMANTVYSHFLGHTWPKHADGAELPPPEYYPILTDLVRQMEAERQGHDWPQLFYYPLDEASADAAPFLAKLLQAVKAVPGARTYVTQIFERESSRVFEEWVDVWCSGYFPTDFEGMAREKARGRVFWCYPNFVACSRGVPNAARITYGFGFWRSGVSCLIPWHYQAACGNPFNDFDSYYGDWCLAYPGPDGPIPTQRWEAIREGIDDYRYVYTLETLIAAAVEEGRDCRDAQELLERLRTSVEPQSRYTQDWPWQHSEYQAWRRRLADEIVKLR